MTKRTKEKFERAAARAAEHGASAVAISKRLQPLSAAIEETLADAAGQPVSFCLFVFDSGYCQYVANSEQRSEIARAVRSVIGKWEAEGIDGGSFVDIPHRMKQ
jgi:hypothetical protein